MALLVVGVVARADTASPDPGAFNTVVPPELSGVALGDSAAGAEAADGELERVRAGDIAIDLRDDLGPGAIAELGRDFAIRIDPNSEFSDAGAKIEIAHVAPSARRATIERLRRDARVEHAEAMHVYRASFVPNDPLYSEGQWHLARVGAERAWSMGCGRGIIVAVIDTGVACYDAPPYTRGSDLQSTRCVGGYDFIGDRREAADDNGHGTHVAGTIAESTHNARGAAGLAHCAKLMPIKVLGASGWGTTTDVAEGIRFAVDNGANIINLSLGGPDPSEIVRDAVDYARAHDVLVVAAAGNTGRAVSFPAAHDGAMAVSASGKTDQIAWFSSRGPEIAISAPGVGVLQQTICDGGYGGCEQYRALSGTSMAAPHVSAAAALLMGAGATRGDSARRLLEATARPADGGRQAYGAGHLDAGRAMQSLIGRELVVRALGLLLAFMLVGWRLKKKRARWHRRKQTIFFALLAGLGPLALFPWLGVSVPGTSAVAPLLEALARPAVEWVALLSAGAERWSLVLTPGILIGAVALGGSVRWLRGAIAGVAIGCAAYAVAELWLAQTSTPGGRAIGLLASFATMALGGWIGRIMAERA